MLRGVIQEITRSLVLEIKNYQCGERPASVSIVDFLREELVEEVVSQFEKAKADKVPSDEDVEAKLQKAERKLEKLGITGKEEAKAGEGLSDENVEAKLQKAERKLEKLGITGEDDGEDEDEDEDEVAGTRSSFPNLKYAKPKYKNIESILKYVETDEDKGGVKLVIMNFND